MEAVRARVSRVKVACGDWKRVLSDSFLFPSLVSGGKVPCGISGVFLDPPYAAKRAVKYEIDGANVAKDVEEWCVGRTDDSRVRVVIAGYEGDYDLPGWSVVPWRAKGGYRKSNMARERLWLSPSCIQPAHKPA